jgi:DNA polymerase-3 subunit beta
MSVRKSEQYNSKSKFVVNKNSIEILKAILNNTDDIVNVFYNNDNTVVKFELDNNNTNIKIIAKCLEGEFIRYEQIIPDEYKLRVKVNVNDLMESIERAALLSREGKTNLVKFEIKDELMEITSNSQMGKVYEEVKISLEGEGIKIAFNSKYLLDVLRIIDCEEIYMEFASSVSPCILKKVDADDYIYLILPVRIVEN